MWPAGATPTTETFPTEQTRMVEEAWHCLSAGLPLWVWGV